MNVTSEEHTISEFLSRKVQFSPELSQLVNIHIIYESPIAPEIMSPQPGSGT